MFEGEFLGEFFNIEKGNFESFGNVFFEIF